MTVLTITYGDQDPETRSILGDDIRGMLASFESEYGAQPWQYYCDRFTGQGWWHDDKGEIETEESGVIVVDTVSYLGAYTRHALRYRLSLIARMHHQDAIGLILSHDSDLIAPAPYEEIS